MSRANVLPTKRKIEIEILPLSSSDTLALKSRPDTTVLESKRTAKEFRIGELNPGLVGSGPLGRGMRATNPSH